MESYKISEPKVLEHKALNDVEIERITKWLFSNNLINEPTINSATIFLYKLFSNAIWDDSLIEFTELLKSKGFIEKGNLDGIHFIKAIGLALLYAKERMPKDL